MYNLIIGSLFLFLNNFIHSEDIQSRLNKPNNFIDVVIPCTEKDLRTLPLCIKAVRKYGKDINRVLVISDKKLTDEAEWFDEKQFEFSKVDIAFEIFQNKERATEYINDSRNRIGWLYQQLLKLYAPLTIPNISVNVLILDADTIFLKPISFMDHEGNALYNVGDEYHIPYFEHMKKLLPDSKRIFQNYSGITHHMLFQRQIIEAICENVKKLHKVELWRAMCRCIDHNHLFNSAFSEYEIYFNFIFAPKKDTSVKLRLLKWTDICNIDSLHEFEKNGFDYVSCHARG